MTSQSRSKLLLLNWNANGISNHVTELQDLLENHLVDIACVTETKLNSNRKIVFNNFKVFRQDRTAQGGGVAILVRNTIKAEAIRADASPCESVGIRITTDSQPLDIYSVYSPPQQADLSGLPSLFTSNSPTIAAGDLNAKHTAWGCVRPNVKGTSLADISCDHQLSIEAPRDPTHIPGCAHYTPDILDIFITKNVTLDKDPWTLAKLSSDHLPVLLEIPISIRHTPLVSTRIDWLLLRYHLENTNFRYSPIRSPDTLDFELEHLTSDINAATRKATTASHVPTRHSDLPRDLIALIKLKNQTLRRLQRNNTPVLRSQRNSLQKLIRSRISEIRSNSFNDFISEAEKYPQSVWKVTRALRNRQPNLPALVVGDSKFNLDSEKAKIFAQSLQLQCSPNASTADFTVLHDEISRKSQDFSPDNNDFIPTTPNEVHRVIRSLTNRKAPGGDGIRNKVLKILPKRHVVAICNIINAIMRLHYFPTAWKEATVVCLPKKGKPLSCPSSYRPISLLSAVSKVAEAVLLSRFNDHIDSHHILPDFQHGFRRHHSTEHQLLRVTEYIADNLNRRRHTAMLLLDAQQAFDRVWHDGLVHKLIELNFPHYLIAVTKSFLANRHIRVRVGDSISDPVGITAGVPQGSKLSPCLFNIFCYDIPHSPKILTAQYADDVAILHASNVIRNCTPTLNRHLSILLKWYDKWRIAINESKSVAVFFSKRVRHKPPEILVNSHRVAWSNSAKYLGVVLDRRLTWIPHINATANKAMGAFLSLAPFFRNPSISHPTKLRVFNAIIRSISTYAISIWGCAKPIRLKRLEGRFMRILRSCLDIPWYVRNSQILREIPTTSPAQHAPIAAARLRRDILQHANPTISTLALYKTKTYDWVNRPCSLLNSGPSP